MSDDDIWDDFESCWAELREKSPIRVVTTKASDLRSQMEIACAQTSFELAQHLKTLQGKSLADPQVLSDLVSKAVVTFMEKWHAALRGQNLAGLIELVLEGQDLTPNEMRGFIQALPESLLNKVVESAIGTATGVHALMALEVHLRARSIRDYTLGKESLRTYVEFHDPGHNAMVRFYLDDLVEGLSQPEKAAPL